MKIVGVIPARLRSTRLPNKALLNIEGLPMVLHVYLRAKMASVLDDVIVATDSEEICEVIKRHGGKVVITSPRHQTGTDRIAEAIKDIGADIVVNIQGDEPLLDPRHIDVVVQPLVEDPDLQVAVLVTPFIKKNSSSDIKAVLDMNDFIMYCSRNDLPSDARSPVDAMWKMSFIVPMRRSFLLEYATWPPSTLEKIEFIEHLRILEHGVKFKAVRVAHADISVDTPEDLEYVRRLMQHDKIKNNYISMAVRKA